MGHHSLLTHAHDAPDQVARPFTALPALPQYDLSTTTYSPDGKVFQIDYAQKAVDNAGCVL